MQPSKNIDVRDKILLFFHKLRCKIKNKIWNVHRMLHLKEMEII